MIAQRWSENEIAMQCVGLIGSGNYHTALKMSGGKFPGGVDTMDVIICRAVMPHTGSAQQL